MFIDLNIDFPLAVAAQNDHEPKPKFQPFTADELASLSFYASFNRWMTRQWKRHLSFSESSLLDFIFDRTVGWGKEWESISLRHMQDGFDHDLAHCASKGTGLSTQACVNGLRRLCALGVLRKLEGQGRAATKYAVNFDWTPDCNTPTYQQAMLKIPKRLQQEGGQTPRSTLPSRAHPSTKLRYKREKGEEIEGELATQAGKPSDVPLPSRLASIVSEVKRQGEQRAEKAKADSRFSVQSLQAIFQNEWSSAFPETPVVAWKQHEGFALKQWGARYQASTKASFSELFAWCVSRWRQVMAHDFKTFKNAPAFPAVGFMVKFSERFQDAYARRAELERRASMTERDTAIARARDKGMDEEAAERHADERLGLQEQKDAITRERRRLLAQQLAVPRVIVAPVVAGVGAARVVVANDFKHKPSLSAMIGRGGDDFQPYEADALR